MINMESKISKNYSEAFDLIEGFSHEIRKQIILQLAEVYPNGLRICEIKTKKCIARPSLSHHFKVLYEAKIIDYVRKGTKNYYFLSLNDSKIDKCIELLNSLKSLTTGEKK